MYNYLALTAMTAILAAPGHSASPVTGRDLPALSSFDELMTSFLAEHDLPGASLAVAKDGCLVYARGFGFADKGEGIPVEPDALFRIASVSKPLTAVAVLQLVERGRVSLDKPARSYLKIKPFLDERKETDPGVERVTVRQLLQHTGGWDRDESYDPMFRPFKIAESLGIDGPAPPREICRYMLGQPLDFAPGTQYAYSNLGYSLLGRLIEDVTGQSYADYVRDHVLAPLGVHGMELGKTDPALRATGEVVYYDRRGREGKMRFGPNEGETVPLPYAAGVVELFDAHGGWLASAVDLVRFASALDDLDRSPLLSRETIETMFARPEGPPGLDGDGNPKASYYGCGWLVRPKPGQGRGRNTWHNGAICGTSTLLVRRWDGLSWAVLFNQRDSEDGSYLSHLIDSRVHKAANLVASWPEDDLFPQYLHKRKEG